MSQPAKHFYDFGPFRLDVEQSVLLQNGQRVNLPPKVFETLRVLVENHGRIVDKAELMGKVWPDTFVEEGNLTVNIFLLRKALSKGLNGISAIETIPRRGYCFVAPVKVVNGELARPGLSAFSSSEVGNHEAAADRPNTRHRELEVDPGAAILVTPVELRLGLASPGAQAVSRRSNRTITVVTAGALVGLTGVLVWLLTRPLPRPMLLNVARLTDFGRADAFDNLVTDGARLYFVEVKRGRRELMQLPLGGGDPALISTPFPGVTLFGVSPNRSELLVGSVAVNEDEVPLWSLPLASGPPHRLGRLIAHDAAWSPDGQKLAYACQSDFYIANADGSRPQKVAALDGSAWWLRWSPDSRLIRFTLKASQSLGFSLWEIHANGTQLRALLPSWRPAAETWGLGESAGVWTPDGRYYLFRSRRQAESIWAIRERGPRFRRAGHEPTPLYEGPASLDFYTLAPGSDGKKLFFIGQEERRQLVRYDAKIQQLVPFLPDLPAHFPGPLCFSNDGRWVAYASSGVLFRSRADGSDKVQLTATPIAIELARFAPDSHRIAFQAQRLGEAPRVYTVSVEGGEPDQISSGPGGDELGDWSPDGKTLLIQHESETPDRLPRAYLLDLKSRQMSLLPGSERAVGFRWSPDGRYVVAARNTRPNGPVIDLFDFQAHAWCEIGSPMSLRNLFWSHDSKYVYGQEVAGDQRVFRVRISDGSLEWVTGSKLALAPDVAAWSFAGLAPDGSPLGVLLRRNSDIYALDLDLP